LIRKYRLFFSWRKQFYSLKNEKREKKRQKKGKQVKTSQNKEETVGENMLA
jgi:hypothetical protein